MKMTFSPDIIVVGSHAPALFIHTNRIPIAGETVIGWDYEEPQDGGKGSNQAIAAARLGAKVSFIGMVGKDRLGENLYRWFETEKVDTKWLGQSDANSTGVGFNIQNKDGDCALITSMGANADIQKNYLESAIKDLSSAKYLLTQFEIPPHIALHAAKFASSLGMTTIVNPAPAVDDPELTYEGVSILIPNEIEAKILAGIPLDREMEFTDILLKIHQKLDIDTIIITLGGNGVVVLSEGEVWSQKPPKTELVDASGAGDQFCAALAVALNNEMDLKSACQWAMHAASISVTRKGTIPAFVRKAKDL